MAVELEIDVQVLNSEIKKTHASVSQEPEKDFIFPTGRPWAEDLGYPAELANVPQTAVGSFAGVASPWRHHRQGLRTGSLANAAARRRGGRGGGDRRARSARRETRARGRLRP